MIEVLNASTCARLPMIPAALPEMHRLQIHGERFAFDANSLLLLHMDGPSPAKAGAMAREGGSLPSVAPPSRRAVESLS